MGVNKLRSINTHFWSDNYIIDLDPIEKLVFLYLLTNENTNMLGIYELNIRRIAFDTGIDRDMLIKIFERFNRDGKMTYIDGYVILHNFTKHQNYNPNMIKSAVTAFNDLPTSVKGCSVCQQIIDSLEGLPKGSKGLPKGSEPLAKIEIEVEDEREREREVESKLNGSTNIETSFNRPTTTEVETYLTSYYDTNNSLFKHIKKKDMKKIGLLYYNSREAMGWRKNGHFINKWRFDANNFAFSYDQNQAGKPVEIDDEERRRRFVEGKK